MSEHSFLYLEMYLNFQMNCHMRIEISFSFKGASTKLAGEWSFSRMNSTMGLQFPIIWEAFRAEFTIVFIFSLWTIYVLWHISNFNLVITCKDKIFIYMKCVMKQRQNSNIQLCSSWEKHKLPLLFLYFY